MKKSQAPPRDRAPPRNQAREARPAASPAAGGIPWTPLPTDPQVRRRSTDALPWRPTPRPRWER